MSLLRCARSRRSLRALARRNRTAHFRRGSSSYGSRPISISTRSSSSRASGEELPMKQVLDAALKTEQTFRAPSAPILAMIAQLASVVAPEARPAIVDRLIAMTKIDIENAEGTDVPLAWAHLRHAASLDGAGRGADADAEATKAAAFVADRGERSPGRFRVHLALLDRALMKKDRDAAEKQLAAAREHVPLDDMEEHPQPEFAVDLAAAFARLGKVDEAFAIMESIDEDARLQAFTEALPASAAFERDPEWARPFLKRLASLTTDV